MEWVKNLLDYLAKIYMRRSIVKFDRRLTVISENKGHWRIKPYPTRLCWDIRENFFSVERNQTERYFTIREIYPSSRVSIVFTLLERTQKLFKKSTFDLPVAMKANFLISPRVLESQCVYTIVVGAKILMEICRNINLWFWKILRINCGHPSKEIMKKCQTFSLNIVWPVGPGHIVLFFLALQFWITTSIFLLAWHCETEA